MSDSLLSSSRRRNVPSPARFTKALQVGLDDGPLERVFGWFGRYRRLSKDYEHNPASSEAWIYVAMIHRMARFSLPSKNKDDDLLKRPPKRLNT